LLDAVTHDLRTPLTSIKTSITTLLDDEKISAGRFQLDAEGRHEFFEIINEETDRLNHFIEGMVQLARIEAGELNLRQTWSEVDEIIQAALARAGAVCSMSRKGNCWDNAPVESFFASLKRELVQRVRFATREQARAAIFEWIEVWYNRERRHSALGYLSPEQFERRHQRDRQRDAMTP